MCGSAGMENTCFKFCACQIGAAYALATVSHFDQRPNQGWSIILVGGLITCKVEKQSKLS